MSMDLHSKKKCTLINLMYANLIPDHKAVRLFERENFVGGLL